MRFDDIDSANSIKTVTELFVIEHLTKMREESHPFCCSFCLAKFVAYTELGLHMAYHNEKEKEILSKPGPTSLGVVTPWSILKDDDETIPDGWKSTEESTPVYTSHQPNIFPQARPPVPIFCPIFFSRRKSYFGPQTP